MEIFVYGTLTDPDRAATVLETVAYVEDVVLEGLHPVEGRYPTLAPGGRTRGRLLRTDEVASLDRYEGVDRGLYVRVAVPREGGGSVQVYVGDPDELGADADWPATDPFEECVERYVREENVRVVGLPPEE